MTKLGLPKSVRKFIRFQKASIRRQFLDFKKQEEMISQLYGRFSQKPIVENTAKKEPEIKPKSKIKEKIVKTQIKNQKSKLQVKIQKLKSQQRQRNNYHETEHNKT